MTRRTERVIAVIIGRAGSKGLPGKNARLLAGRPMIGYSIDDARHAACVERVIVSTDCPLVMSAAGEMGVRVITRPAVLATDEATVDAAVRHAIRIDGTDAEVIVILYANVPVRPAVLIDRAVKCLSATGADSVQSYASVGKYHPHWMVRLDDERRVEAVAENAVYRRQDLPPLWIPDGGVIAVRRPSLFTVRDGEPHAFLGGDRRGITNEPGEVVDIDTEADLIRAEAAMAESPALAAS